MILFSEQAIAQDAASEGAGLGSLLPLVMIFAIFYFLIIRPQSKKIKQHTEMVKSLKKGDRVITAGGIEGVISKIDEESALAEVEIAEGVIVKVVRSTITDVSERNEAKPKTKLKAVEKSRNKKRKSGKIAA